MTTADSPTTGSLPPGGVRVAMFINSLQRGGAETQFLRVAKALRAAGNDVRIFVLLPDNDFGEELDGLRVTLLGARIGPSILINATRELRAWRPAVVLNFLYQATLVGRLAALVARVPVVISSMRNERLESAARTALFRRTTRRDAVVVANSHRTAQVLVANGTVPSGKMRVIANGLPVPQPHAGARERLRNELGVDELTFLFLGVGRLTPQKDWATLVAAVAQYSGPPARWLVAGSGPDEADLRAQISSAGLDQQVTLLGLRDDIPDLLAACDAVVLSSTYEGMPNVVLEAMAVGRPAVVTRVGACAELLADDADPGGLLVPSADAQALAHALCDLAALTTADRDAMGRRNTRVVAERYTLEAAERNWTELVAELVGRSPRSAVGTTR